MSTGIATLRTRWLAVAAAAVLLVMALTAGTLFAAYERQNTDIQPAIGQLPSEPLTNHETDLGLTAEYRALAAQDEAEQNDRGTGVSQVVPDTDCSDALALWLADQPEQMGFITREDALTADADTMDWLLYQAVYKDVLTQEEADAIQAWFDRRPSVEEAPELLQHQPTHLDTPDGRNTHIKLLRETEAR